MDEVTVLEGRDEVRNGDHLFVFPRHPIIGEPGSLGRCQGPCRIIVTRNEALHRPMGPCVKP